MQKIANAFNAGRINSRSFAKQNKTNVIGVEINPAVSVRAAAEGRECFPWWPPPDWRRSGPHGQATLRTVHKGGFEAAWCAHFTSRQKERRGAGDQACCRAKSGIRVRHTVIPRRWSCLCRRDGAAEMVADRGERSRYLRSHGYLDALAGSLIVQLEWAHVEPVRDVFAVQADVHRLPNEMIRVISPSQAAVGRTSQKGDYSRQERRNNFSPRTE